MRDCEIVIWIRKIFKADCYEHFTIDIEGKNERTEGYASDMVFLEIIQSRYGEEHQELNLAVKFAKKFLRKIPLMRSLYIKEIFFYNEVVSLFKKYEEEYNISDPLDALPYCHATYLDHDMEILILENLRKCGYCLHSRKYTMDMDHIKIILKNFAKIHALSFSIKEQNLEMFDNLIQNGGFHANSDILELMGDIFEKSVTKIIQTLKAAGKIELHNKFQGLIKSDMKQMIAEILCANVDKAVIVHTDCHNNNFMFRYKEDLKTQPTNVAILDWQMARYHSPVIDLSYLLYSVASKAELAQTKYLLNYYHTELSKFLTKLGNNPDSIYPFSFLRDHWQKYSFYGFAHACSFLDYNFVENQDAPTLDNVEDVNSLAKQLSSVNLIDTDLYQDRLIAIIEYYFDNIDI